MDACATKQALLMESILELFCGNVFSVSSSWIYKGAIYVKRFVAFAKNPQKSCTDCWIYSKGFALEVIVW